MTATVATDFPEASQISSAIAELAGARILPDVPKTRSVGRCNNWATVLTAPGTYDGASDAVDILDVLGLDENTHNRLVNDDGATRLQLRLQYPSTYNTITPVIQTTVAGVVAVDEVQTLEIPDTVTAGTFTVSYSGQTTSALAFDIVAADLQTALEALSNLAPGDVVVGGGPGATAAFTLTFGGTLAGTPLSEITVDSSSLTGGTAVVGTTTQGVAAVNEVQTLTIPTTATGGTFTITYAGQTTSALAYNVDATATQVALLALSNLAPGDVVVSGGPGATAALTLTFGGTLAGTNVAQITATGSLTGAAVTAPIVQVFGMDGDSLPIRHKTIAAATGATLTPAAADVKDQAGTSLFTDYVEFDVTGSRHIVVGIKTKLVAPGITTGVVVQARLV